jgi:hypothetical protein
VYPCSGADRRENEFPGLKSDARSDRREKVREKKGRKKKENGRSRKEYYALAAQVYISCPRALLFVRARMALEHVIGFQ